ncbi:uncharacterized protein LOC125500585 [Athalia rosae]|uniref:uncharacterized protein LOC125500585 n=1 Tax=Athalia rosae TaxID=37344 RepID=UPI0020335E3B|nr:uncharacterized protein LOC125500585 [Athalia rosae]
MLAGQRHSGDWLGIIGRGSVRGATWWQVSQLCVRPPEIGVQVGPVGSPAPVSIQGIGMLDSAIAATLRLRSWPPATRQLLRRYDAVLYFHTFLDRRYGGKKRNNIYLYNNGDDDEDDKNAKASFI